MLLIPRSSVFGPPGATYGPLVGPRPLLRARSHRGPSVQPPALEQQCKPITTSLSLGRKCLSNRACSHTCTCLCVEVQQTHPRLRGKFSYCSNFHLPRFTSCLSILLYMTTLQGTKHCDGLDLPTGSKRTETETCPLSVFRISLLKVFPLPGFGFSKGLWVFTGLGPAHRGEAFPRQNRRPGAPAPSRSRPA